jgi:hypothetical protein
MNSTTQDKENDIDRINHAPPGSDNNDDDDVESRKSTTAVVVVPTIENVDIHVGKQSRFLQPTSSPGAQTAATPANTIASSSSSSSIPILARDGLYNEISKQVLRHKLQKLRHLVLNGAINPTYLDSLFPSLLERFHPQHVTYNGGVAQIKEWKISCYLEVMEGGVPCTDPNTGLLNDVFRPLLDVCDDLFLEWYRQQHAGNDTTNHGRTKKKNVCRRLMTFVTRYTPAPGEQALLKHVDGAGKVDGSVVVALPIDRWSAPYEVNSFEGHGGGLTFWDGRERVDVSVEEKEDEEEKNVDIPPSKVAAATTTTTMTNPPRQKRTTTHTVFRPREIHYETRSGDIAFIDRAVWHQADPITKGTRWALVIFYKVQEEE